uniref:Uncharacterized protein n=1 Tax=Canis lupus dingo TaxID=286419 RepID=A0A8C0KD54_CANLU
MQRRYNRTIPRVLSVEQDYITLLTSVCIPDEAFANYITSVINSSHGKVLPYFYTPYFLTLDSILKKCKMATTSTISLSSEHILEKEKVWIVTLYDLSHSFRPVVLLLMLLSVYKAFVTETFIHPCSLGSWIALLAQVVVTGLLALSTLALYVPVVNMHS